MSKKRKREKVEFYDHTAYQHEATASRVDYDYQTRRAVVETRVVPFVPPDVEAPPERALSPPPPDATQDIREDDVEIVVRAKTRAKRYVNSVRF